MKRKTALLLVLVIIASIFAACGGGANNAPAAQQPAAQQPAATPAAPAAPAAPADTGPEPVEIRASWWGDTWRHELYGSIIDLFEEKNPHITVVREPVSWNDYWEKMAVQVAGGNATDFLCSHPNFIGDYAPKGVYVDLDPYVAEGIITLDGWAPGTLDYGLYKGTRYMLSMGITYSSNFVNATAFKDLGIEPPGFNWTWDELEAKAKEVRAAFQAKGENSWLIGDESLGINEFKFFARQLGYDNYTEDGDLGFTAEVVQQWFEIWKNLRDQDLIPDPGTGAEFKGATLEDNMFSRGRVIIGRTPVNQAALWTNTFPDREIDIIRGPSTPGGKPGEFTEGAWYSVYANTTPEKQLAAAMLIQNWLNTPESLALYKLDQGVPGNLDLSYAYLGDLSPAQVKNVDFVNEVSKLATASPYAPAGASEILSLFELKGEEVQWNAKTPAQAAQEFFDEATAIRARS